MTVYGQARFFNPPPARSRPPSRARARRRLRRHAAAATAAAAAGRSGDSMPRPRPARVPRRRLRREDVGSGRRGTPPKTDGGRDAASKLIGADDATDRRTRQAGEAAAKTDDGSAEAGKSAAPSAGRAKSDTEAATPKP